MQRPTAKHQAKLGESCRRVQGRTERPEGSRIPQEDLQSQLTWAHGGSQKLNHQPESIQGLHLGPLTYIAAMKLAFHVSPLTIGAGADSDSVACLWISYLGCWAQWERMH